jgi:hypothetical protein
MHSESWRTFEGLKFGCEFSSERRILALYSTPPIRLGPSASCSMLAAFANNDTCTACGKKSQREFENTLAPGQREESRLPLTAFCWAMWPSRAARKRLDSSSSSTSQDPQLDVVPIVAHWSSRECNGDKKNKKKKRKENKKMSKIQVHDRTVGRSTHLSVVYIWNHNFIKFVSVSSIYNSSRI